MPRDRLLRPPFAIGLWAALCLLAVFYGNWQDYGARTFLFAVLLAGELWLAAPALRESLLRASGPQGGVLVALWPLGAYLIYALGTGSMGRMRVAVAVTYALVPLLLETSAHSAKPGVWQDYVAMAAVFLPFKLGWLHDLFPSAPLNSRYAFTLLFAINVALAAFLFVRRMEGVGYSIGWRADWAGMAALSFFLIALIAIPEGLALHFVQFDPAPPDGAPRRCFWWAHSSSRHGPRSFCFGDCCRTACKRHCAAKAAAGSSRQWCSDSRISPTEFSRTGGMCCWQLWRMSSTVWRGERPDRSFPRRLCIHWWT